MENGDRVRIDLKKCTADMLVDDATLKARAEAIMAAGGYKVPESQSPWQEIFRDYVGRFDEGMTLRGATKYQDISRKYMPRDNH